MQITELLQYFKSSIKPIAHRYYIIFIDTVNNASYGIITNINTRATGRVCDPALSI